MGQAGHALPRRKWAICDSFCDLCHNCSVFLLHWAQCMCTTHHFSWSHMLNICPGALLLPSTTCFHGTSILKQWDDFHTQKGHDLYRNKWLYIADIKLENHSWVYYRGTEAPYLFCHHGLLPWCSESKYFNTEPGHFLIPLPPFCFIRYMFSKLYYATYFKRIILSTGLVRWVRHLHVSLTMWDWAPESIER